MQRLDQKEYIETYIKGDYVNNHPAYESIVKKNFLNDDELEAFESASTTDDIFYVHDTSMGPIIKEHFGNDDPTTANYYIFDNFYTKPAWSHLVDIIQPKLEGTFGPNIKASHIHVLDSRFPYGLHNDAEQPNMIIAPEPAWTLIIPLFDYPSKTYVFNERSGFKDPWSWINAEKITPNSECAVDYDTYMSDFYPYTGHDLLHYLTVESTFEWRRGRCFAADRYRYHCSDNYFNHGISGKKAIIVWTSV